MHTIPHKISICSRKYNKSTLFVLINLLKSDDFKCSSALNQFKPEKKIHTKTYISSNKIQKTETTLVKLLNESKYYEKFNYL